MSNAIDVISRLQQLFGVTTDAALAREMRIPGSTVGSWRSRESVPYDECLEVAERRGVSLDWLLLGKGQAPGSSIAEDSANYTLTEGQRIAVVVAGQTHYVDPSFYRWVPVLNVKVAGGAGSPISSENIIAFNAYRKEWLESRGLLNATLSEVEATGRSMWPKIAPGESVLVNHSARQIRGGDIFVIRIGDELVVKYLQQLPNGGVLVSSENSAAFPSFQLSASDFDSGNVDVVGAVVPRGGER